MARRIDIKAAMQAQGAVIRINGPIMEFFNDSEDFERQVQDLIDQGAQDVTVRLNTPGGYIFEANEIVNIIKRFPGTIFVECGALCASAGISILLAADRENRNASSNTQFMIHRPEGRVSGNEDDVESYLQALRNVQEALANQIVEETELTMEQLQERWQSDEWFNAENAQRDGFISTIDGQEAQMEQEDLTDIQDLWGQVPNNIAAMATGKAGTGSGKQSTSQTKSNDMDRTVMISTLNLSNDASDNDIVKAIQDLKQKADSADQVQEELNNLKAQQEEEKVTNLVNKAVEDKKITEGQKDHYIKLAKADFESTKAVLDNMQPADKLSQQVQPSNTAVKEGEPETESYDEYKQKCPEKLKAMADPNHQEHDKYQRMVEAKFGKEVLT